MATTLVRNISGVPLALPLPYSGLLAAGGEFLSNDSVATIIANFGGANVVVGLLDFEQLPGTDTQAASPQASATSSLTTAGAALHGSQTASTTPGVGGGTAPAFTGNAQSFAGQYEVIAPPAAETTSVAANQNLANSAVTLATQPAYPCKLQVVITDANSSVAGTIAIVGVGPAGEAVNESLVITAQGTHTYKTANAFAKVTSITPNCTGIDAGTDKINVGQAADLGLPIPSGATNVVVYKEGLQATGGAAVPVDETVGTVDATARTIAPTTAANGTRAYTFWYGYQITPAGSVASHTHTGAAHTHTQV